jgi:hypothetical protein
MLTICYNSRRKSFSVLITAPIKNFIPDLLFDHELERAIPVLVIDQKRIS